MLVYAVALVGLAVLVLLYRRDRGLLKAQRAQFFDLCLDLFQSYRVTQEGPVYPRLSGRYRGHEVRLDPVIDTMAWRKVPVLWLKVTVLHPNAYGGILDFLRRPGAVEMYSPSADLHHHLTVPAGWPEQALLCTDDPSAAPPLDLITPHMAVFEDEYMKELVVTSRGVRLMRMIWQANRLYYAVFRDARFEGVHLDPMIARKVLDSAVAIAEALAQSDAVGRAA